MDVIFVRVFVGDCVFVILMILVFMLLVFGIVFYLDWKVVFVVLVIYLFMVGVFIGEVMCCCFVLVIKVFFRFVN